MLRLVLFEINSEYSTPFYTHRLCVCFFRDDPKLQLPMVFVRRRTSNVPIQSKNLLENSVKNRQKTSKLTEVYGFRTLKNYLYIPNEEIRPIQPLGKH